MNQYIRATLWGFVWGYIVAFVLCMGFFIVMTGDTALTFGGLMDIAHHVLFTKIERFLLGVGGVAAIIRLLNTGGNDEESRNQEELAECEELMESWWENRPK